MLENNKTIEINGEDALEVLAEIEFILISLHKMGSYYCDKPVKRTKGDRFIFRLQPLVELGMKLM
ncbi:hypothetical protein SAMN03159313_2183 [Pseudomonas sp. NFIX46]|nr:hypothetical protein SAMN03159313_2183 [Pseudomonas sp. NFIX46]SDB07813.1 hypothetical protein SAMN03097715_00549 [Pseudomonas putida]